MWKDFLSFIQTVVTLSREIAQNREEIKELKKTVVEHTLLLQRLADQIEMNRRADVHEREKLALQLQVEMLKFERRLPPAEKGE
jgi:cell shape-determining protein MreC